VWVVPTREAYSTLAYTSSDSIHYFRYTIDNVIVQSIWSTPVNTMNRAFVYSELREWYRNVSNNNLTSNMTDTDDVVAWFVSRE
jgi:hypothetical protein